MTSAANHPNSPNPIATIAQALKRERERAGLSLSELARQAGIAKSTLSQLEAGQGNPSIESLWSVALALDVPFSRLLEPTKASVHVVRAHEGMTVNSADAPYQVTLLSTSPPLARRDVYRIQFEPGQASRQAAAHAKGTIEHVIVMQGRARVGPVGNEVELAPGDYAAFAADEAHVYHALEPSTSAVVILEYV
ncbi:helix-turn-helix transcriptional regulator [Curvibacter sp. CHRR-16]|uniref:helix-turn-helix domain-containing protein n=1 Tax=Curvibacter sp. CHRR-16 TaxID=2835872 RepID=UPI001BDB2BC8|nr:XRE family transcriptional regulator [Curvibacter sp. CHRR-16]MBT0568784.1 helix-turn-helix transcriptional regulator [Curvibacter sp. CHRR-16]